MRHSRALFPSSLLLSAALSPACSGDGEAVGGDGGARDPWADVEVSLDPFSLRYGTAELAPGALRVGSVPVYDPAEGYDPINLKDPDLAAFAPSVSWSAVETAAWEGEALRLEFDDGGQGMLSLRPGQGAADDQGLPLRLSLDHISPYISLSFTSPEADGIYGLGETFDAVEQRGQVRAMQIELDSELESSYNEAHVPVPFFVDATLGFGVGVESDWPMVFDVGVADPDLVEVVVATEQALDFRLFGADVPGEVADPVEVVAAWTRASGLPRLPPTWAGAPFIWRNENVDGQEVLDDALAIRDNDLAFGVLWVDNPWQTSYNSMQPDPEQFPEWDTLVSQLHALGFRWMAWSTPYVEEADPEFATYRDEGLLVDLPIEFNQFGPLVDLTLPAAMERWQGRVAAARDRGIEGWKLDYGEDVQVGYGGRLPTEFANGQDERTMHHRFAEYYDTAYAAPYDTLGRDRFLLGRGGAWGTQSEVDCIWPGDLDNDLRRHGEEGHVGGLPSAIRGGTSLSMSGFPCFASDTGGYRHGRANEETIIRWTEYSALLPVMQVGGGENHHYWLLEGDWTERVLEVGQRYTQLHIQLFPYLRALQVAASTVGTPILRPPELVGGPRSDDSFLVGEALFVAPVEVAGATSRTVNFPPGGWVHWWTGDRYEGEAEVAAPLGEGPLFIAEGGIVPMLRSSVRTLSPATEEGVDSWANDKGDLTIRFVPGEGRFTVVDGPTIVGGSDHLTIGEPGIYRDTIVTIWAPEASSILEDGVAIDTSKDGPWLRATAGRGELSWR